MTSRIKSMMQMDGLKNLHRYEDVMCFQSKVDRELAYKYDVIRRLMGKTRRESLEDYFQHEIDLYKSSDWKSESGLDDLFNLKSCLTS